MLFNKDAQKTLLHGINTKINSKIGINDIPQSDWNETNPFSKGYIKNKTHWIQTHATTILKDYNPPFCLEGYYTMDSIEIIPNTNYVLTVNDTEYFLTSYCDEYDTYWLGGDISLFDTGVSNDTTCPFLTDGYLIYVFIDATEPKILTIEQIMDDNSKVTLIDHELITYYTDNGQIDIILDNYDLNNLTMMFDNISYKIIFNENDIFVADKFILYKYEDYCYLEPATTGVHNCIIFADSDIIANHVLVAASYWSEPNEIYFPVSDQDRIMVKWNNQQQIYTPLLGGEEYYGMGNLSLVSSDFPDSNEPFFIDWAGNYIVNLARIKPVSFSFYVLTEEVHKLDPKFIELPSNVITEDRVGEITSDIRYSLNSKMAMHNPKGAGSFSMNRKSTSVTGTYSTAEGYECEASGAYSHAEGSQTVASGQGAHAEGIKSIASGYSAHAEGNQTKAQGYQSHAEGISTVASGNSAHAEGASTDASGLQAHAEGSSTTASGPQSHAEGSLTDAAGSQSHAEGYSTSAIGAYSHAEGYRTYATGSSQHVQGEWNVPDQNTSTPARTLHAHIVGNGTGIDARSNAHTLDWDGNAWFAGDVYVGSGSGVNRDSGSKKLATEDFVNSAVTNLVNAAPEALNTLNELAAALGDDPNFATTITTEIGKKVDKVDGKGLSTNDFTNEYKEKLDGLENYVNESLATSSKTEQLGNTITALNFGIEDIFNLPEGEWVKVSNIVVDANHYDYNNVINATVRLFSYAFWDSSQKEYTEYSPDMLVVLKNSNNEIVACGTDEYGNTIDLIQCRADGIYFWREESQFPISLTLPNSNIIPMANKPKAKDLGYGYTEQGSNTLEFTINPRSTEGVLNGGYKIFDKTDFLDLITPDPNYGFFNNFAIFYSNQNMTYVLSALASDNGVHTIVATDENGNTFDFGILCKDNSGYNPGLYVSEPGKIEIPGYIGFPTVKKIDIDFLPMDKIKAQFEEVLLGGAW